MPGPPKISVKAWHDSGERSQGSLDFEALWRSLPRQGLVPDRAAFNPTLAKKFLNRIILVEAPTAEKPALYFRLAGQTLNDNVQRNMAGTNWLDFIPGKHHAEALEAARLICSHPCGIWQLTPVHYDRGISQLIEATIFPLGPGVDGVPLMLGNLEFAPAAVTAELGKGVSAETSQVYKFIDIGAGMPTLVV